VLASFDVTLDEARHMVTRMVGPGDEEPTGPISLTPRSKDVLELALREAVRLRSAHVGSEHILLGLVREYEGVAARILLDVGADEAAVREETLRAVGLPEEAALETETLSFRPSPRRHPRSCSRSCSPHSPFPRGSSSASSSGAEARVDSRAMAEQLPKRFPDRALVADVRAEAATLEPGGEANDTRRLAGRVLGRRGHGKLVFLDLVDRSGQIQLLCAADRAGPVDLDLGDIVGVTGKPAMSKRGEPSLAVDELELLAEIAGPLPDTYHGLVEAETRYRKRYLDLLVNEDTRRDFMLRSRMVSAIRRRLDEDGFVEVETPVLQPRYGGAFAEPFVTYSNALDADLYLRIATELYLKRLIVGGLERVYEIGKDFRNEGLSPKHQPEFTMLEWYEAYADYRDTMERIERLVDAVARDVLGTTKVEFRGREIDLAAPWKRLSFVDALAAEGVWSQDEAELRTILDGRGVDTSHDRTWGQLVDHALGHFVEPNLIRPTILHDYPVELSPFARASDGDPRMVERFEYFIGGMELGNAFSELGDAGEQAERFRMQDADRAAGDPTAEVGDPDYVEALSYGMPPTGGLGLGIDRLAMIFTGRETIRDVILFPALRERGS
jgi:lysyl-tRNA synthetase class 2